MVDGGENTPGFHKPKLIQTPFRESRMKEDDAIENDNRQDNRILHSHTHSHNSMSEQVHIGMLKANRTQYRMLAC